MQRDEPLFEISTDKVDAEIPSPAAGTLTEIKVGEGTTVQINTVVAVLAEEGGATAPSPAAPKAEGSTATPQADGASAPKTAEAPAAPATETSSAAAGKAVDVIMPQMGESIFEGTITKWLKKVGDAVAQDEPLFEISTDKVDAEIPSPTAGTLTEIKVPEGTTVQINTVVAVIGGAAGAGKAPAAPSKAAPAATPAPQPAAAKQEQPDETEEAATVDGVRSSPLVRKIAKEHNLDLSKVKGSGSGGRITKDDALAAVAQRGAAPAAPGAQPTVAASAAKPAAPAPASTVVLGELVPLSRMRSIIAQRMVESGSAPVRMSTPASRSI